MILSELSKDERSLLLYIESCAVDQGGLVHNLRINAEKRDILERWNKDKFIFFSRITTASLKILRNKHQTGQVFLSENAWELAHKERRARNLRMLSTKPYCNIVTTKTKNW